MALRFRKGDILAIAAVVLLAAVVFCLFLPRKTAASARAQIYLDGKLLRAVDLSRDQSFSVSGAFHATLTVKDGAIAVTASDCPGGDCLRSGWISTGGRSIFCLPGGLEIRVVAEDAVDFVVR